MGKSERKIRMEEGFMSCRAKGMSIAEIAEKYHVSTWTVYQSLQGIADANGVTRDSLLDVVQSHKTQTPTNRRKIENINAEELKKDFADLDDFLGEIITKVDNIIMQQEETR